MATSFTEEIASLEALLKLSLYYRKKINWPKDFDFNKKKIYWKIFLSEKPTTFSIKGMSKVGLYEDDVFIKYVFSVSEKDLITKPIDFNLIQDVFLNVVRRMKSLDSLNN